eukprot:TRINITY_DN1348_c0_g1_i2.p1 TRINITY_DN1348_c0_g1~~TRINITY_DN1348_c0_g1_i2.p1  ORF type:complete len:302 (+),score=40.98 TRINITY_DN1348_c0_g1_i2:207-1112(+)
MPKSTDRVRFSQVAPLSNTVVSFDKQRKRFVFKLENDIARKSLPVSASLEESCAPVLTTASPGIIGVTSSGYDSASEEMHLQEYRSRTMPGLVPVELRSTLAFPKFRTSGTHLPSLAAESLQSQSPPSALSLSVTEPLRDPQALGSDAQPGLDRFSASSMSNHASTAVHTEQAVSPPPAFAYDPRASASTVSPAGSTSSRVLIPLLPIAKVPVSTVSPAGRGEDARVALAQSNAQAVPAIMPRLRSITPPPAIPLLVDKPVVLTEQSADQDRKSALLAPLLPVSRVRPLLPQSGMWFPARC